MAYAYIKGAELPALQYYEILLAHTVDSKERSKIEEILRDIRTALESKHQLENSDRANMTAPRGSVNLSV